MIVAKISISYDRGIARNHAGDLVGANGNGEAPAQPAPAILGRGEKTADGKVIRGIGSHFKSETVAERVRICDAVAKSIYQSFRERFVASPVDGLYVLPERGAGKAFIQSLAALVDNVGLVNARVQEYDLTTDDDLESREVLAWSRKIQNQLAGVQLGRKKEIDENGLDALLALSKCPVLQEGTAKKIRNAVAAVRAQKIDRIELKRRIDNLTVEIDSAPLSIRRIPTVAEDSTEPVADPA